MEIREESRLLSEMRNRTQARRDPKNILQEHFHYGIAKSPKVDAGRRPLIRLLSKDILL